MESPRAAPQEGSPDDLTPEAAARDPRSHPLLANVPSHAGYKVLDPCVLTGVLGRGGMGVVFRAFHLRLGIEVAVKCMLPRFSTEPGFAERFRREANAAARIQHTNVVRVFDVAERHGIHFLIMELIEGEHAGARVLRRGQLEIPEALELAWGASRGLAAAHRAGVMHRDVKPDNIAIAADGEVKLLDLGLAKPVAHDSDPMTRTQAVFGTPQYMPPEQWGGAREVSPAGDVWAMGATLYYFLTSQHALPSDPAGACGAVMSGPFPDPRELRPEIPTEVAELVAHCTQADIDLRPRDGIELAKLLEGLSPAASLLKRAAEESGPASTDDSAMPPPRVIEEIRRSSEPTQQSDPPPASRFTFPRLMQMALGAGFLTLSAYRLVDHLFLQPDVVVATPAVIELHAIQDRTEFTDQDTYTVSGRVRDAWQPTVEWRQPGGLRTLVDLQPDGRFAFDVPLRAGATTRIELTAEGADTSAVGTLVRDTQPPSVRFLKPAEGARTAADSIDVEIALVEANPLSVRSGLREFERLDDGTWRLRGLQLFEGEQTIEVTATDAAGLETVQQLTLVVDRSAPETRTVEPAETAVLQPGLVTLRLEADETLGAATLDGRALAISGAEAWTEWEVPERTDSLALELRLEDTLGNATVRSLVYAVEPPPPPPVVPPPVTRVAELEPPTHTETAAGGQLNFAGRSEGPADQLRVRLESLEDAEIRIVLEPLDVPTGGRFEHTASLPDDLPGGAYALVLEATQDGEDFRRELQLDRTAPLLITGSNIGTEERPLVHSDGTLTVDLRFNEPARLHLGTDASTSAPWTPLDSVHSALDLPIPEALRTANHPITLDLTAVDARGNATPLQAIAISRPLQVLREAKFPPEFEVDVEAGTFTLWLADGTQETWSLPGEGAYIAREPTTDRLGALTFEIVSGGDRTEMILITGGAVRGAPGLKPFLIDRYELTAARYDAHAESAGRPAGKAQRPDQSLSGLSADEAEAFATWAAKRLPSEAQWRAAAGWNGDQVQAFSWGPELDPVPVRLAPGALLLARDLESDRSPYGVFGMGTGLSEWALADDPLDYRRPVLGGSSFATFLNDRSMEAYYRLDAAARTLPVRNASPSDLAAVGVRCVLELAPQ